MGVWAQIERGGLALSCVALLIACALGGRAYGMDALADMRLAASIPAAGNARGGPSDAPRSKSDIAREFAETVAQPDVLTATAELHRVLGRKSVTVMDFSIERGLLDVQVQPPPGVSLQEIASDMEASPLLAGVAPEFDNRTGLGRITATVCQAGGGSDGDMDCLRRRAQR